MWFWRHKFLTFVMILVVGLFVYRDLGAITGYFTGTTPPVAEKKKDVLPDKEMSTLTESQQKEFKDMQTYSERCRLEMEKWKKKFLDSEDGVGAAVEKRISVRIKEKEDLLAAKEANLKNGEQLLNEAKKALEETKKNILKEVNNKQFKAVLVEMAKNVMRMAIVFSDEGHRDFIANPKESGLNKRAGQRNELALKWIDFYCDSLVAEIQGLPNPVAPAMMSVPRPGTIVLPKKGNNLPPTFPNP